MIGRGLVVFRHKDGRNDLHFVDPWGMATMVETPGFDKSMKKTAREKKWIPSATVDDNEVEQIQKATSSNEGSKGYHQYASDIVRIIHVTDEDLKLTLKEAAEISKVMLRKAEQEAWKNIRELAKTHGFNMKELGPLCKIHV